LFNPLLFVEGAAERGDIPSLVGLLTHARLDVRTAAARELEKLGGPHTTAELVEAMGHADAHLRWSAVRALGAVGGASAVEPLAAKLLNATHHVDRWHAATALGRIGDGRGTAPLVRALDDRKIRVAAIEALGEIGGAEARAALERIPTPRWRPYLRMTVKEALAQLDEGEPSARGAPRTALARTSTALTAGLVAVILSSVLLGVVAVVLFKADASQIAIVAGAAFVLLLPWHVLRKRVADTAADWVRAADECVVPDPALEPSVRTWLRIHVNTFLVLPIDIALVGLGALLTYPEVAAGIVAGSPGFVRFALAARWVRDWERRNGTALYREAKGPDELRRRFVLSR
jgi:hypothetical protein